MLSILLVTPLLGLLAVQLPLQPPALALGLGVFCCMPTALSSGITFTQVGWAVCGRGEASLLSEGMCRATMRTCRHKAGTNSSLTLPPPPRLP